MKTMKVRIINKKFARELGLEPKSVVLETIMLPLHHSRIITNMSNNA